MAGVCIEITRWAFFPFGGGGMTGLDGESGCLAY